MEWPAHLKGTATLPRHWYGLGLAIIAATATVAATVVPAWLVMLLALCLFCLCWLVVTAPAFQTDIALQESERKFRTFVEQSLVGLYVVQDGKVVYANKKSASLLGYDNPDDLIGLPIEALTAPEDIPLLQENHRRRLSGEMQSIRYTYRALRRDGSSGWAEVHGSVCDFEGRPAVMGIALDVSERVEFERQSRLANRVFESASEGIVITDADCRIEAVNPAFTRITGYAAAQAIGKLSRMMTGQGAQAEINRNMLDHLMQEGHWQGEMRDRRKNGEWYPAWLSISTVRDAGRNITNYVGVFTDNTSRKETENRLQFLATHDSLTRMLNRSGLMTEISEQIASARGAGRQLALLFIDLDRFKIVNDMLGHSAGDQVLAAAAERMMRQVQEGTVVARLGGDEFTILLNNAPTATDAADLAQRLIDALAEPFVIDGMEMFVTASIGIACYPMDGEDRATLLKHADIAMYRAKEHGKNTFRFYTRDMNTRTFEQLLLENNLRHALERHEFELHYQPQVATATGQIVAVEALVRWHHPALGLVLPGNFIALAEQTGLIVPLGAWVLREACRQGKAWLDAGYQFDHIAVNLSARQFLAGDLLDTIRAALDTNGMPAEKLELEITESTIMHNPQDAVVVLQRLRSMGVALSIDDFGTGYSSLASLKQYPLDSLKIDRSFVQGIPHDSDDVAITETIIAIAHKMRLKVVAEGVETSAQADFLRSAGCDMVQGFMLGRPMPAAELALRLPTACLELRAP